MDVSKCFNRTYIVILPINIVCVLFKWIETCCSFPLLLVYGFTLKLLILFTLLSLSSWPYFRRNPPKRAVSLRVPQCHAVNLQKTLFMDFCRTFWKVEAPLKGDYIEFGEQKQQYNTVSSVRLKLQLHIVFLMKILLSCIHLGFFDL